MALNYRKHVQHGLQDISLALEWYVRNSNLAKTEPKSCFWHAGIMSRRNIVHCQNSWRNRIGRAISQYGGCCKQATSQQVPQKSRLPEPASQCTATGVALIGESSGAHLAALYATTMQHAGYTNTTCGRPRPVIAACVLISGVYGIITTSA